MPSKLLTLAELPRTLFDIGILPLKLPGLLRAPRGDGHPLLVIPGFGTTDRSTFVLRRYLRFLGYRVHGWGLGRNLGAKTIGLHNEVLHARVARLHAAERRKITLIGWSMGGIMARMIAREQPAPVRQVITLGAPFTGDPYANNAWRLYERLSGHSLSHPVAQAQIRASKFPPPVRSTSIFSKSDGVVAWQSCIEPPAPTTDNVEVSCSHCGFGTNADVLRAVAQRLAA